MECSIEVLAEGLGHPQGPDLLAPGVLGFSEGYRGRLSTWSEADGVTTLARTEGAPNAMLAGSAGEVYFCQNGGDIAGWKAPLPQTPAVGRVRDDGDGVDTVCSSAAGRGFVSPHDMIWGPDGRLWFTDSGRWEPETRPDPGAIVAIHPDGSAERVLELEKVYPCGLGFDPDGSLVWCEGYSRKLRRRRPDGGLETVATLPEGNTPEALKLDVEGRYWVPCFDVAGIHVVSPQGEFVDFLSTGGGSVPLNCEFDGSTLYILDFGVPGAGLNLTGRILRAEVGVRGQERLRTSLERPLTPPSDL